MLYKKMLMIKRTIKILLLTGLIIASTALYATILYASSEINQYDNEDLSLQEVEKKYHERVNEIFNSKLTLLKQGEKGSGTSEIPKNDECGEKNYSTYCLAISVAKEYDKYSFALNKRRSYTKIEKQDMTLEEVAIITINQQNQITRELERSKKALDIAIRTYDEILVTYRMHIQYEKIIKSLTKYNSKLTDFRKEVERLPGKFIDATTTQCT